MTDTPLWRRALGTIVELDPAPQAGVPKTLPASTAPPVAVVLTQADQARADSAYTTLMQAALARRTAFSGLLEQAEKMRAVPGLDDTQRIKAAAVSSGNSTIDVIMQAAQAHLGDVTVERNKFARELASSRATKIDLCKSKAAELVSRIETTRSEIARLTSFINDHEASVRGFEASAVENEAELTAAAAAFEASAQAVEQYIVASRDSIISAIK